MATTNVKILLRRGLREHIGVNTLDTGEMGFTTDTNQLFVGIDESIDEVQFDVFANAHAIIQTWLDSSDNPYQHLGLKVDEDLVIRGVPDVDVMINAMHFYLQNVEWDGEVEFTPGEIVYLKQFIYADDRVKSSEIDKGKTYVIKVVGNTDYTLLGAEENKVNVKFTATGVGPLNGDGEVLEVVDVEDYTQGSVVSTSYDPIRDITDVTVYLRHNTPIFAQDIAPQRDFYNMNKSEWGLFEWDGTEWVHHVVDNVHDAGSTEPVNADVDYTGDMVKPLDAEGIVGDVSVVIGDGAVRYWKKKNWGWSLLGKEHNATGEATIVNNSTTHHLADNLVDAFEFDSNGRWEVTITKFKGTEDEVTFVYDHASIIDPATSPNLIFWYFDVGMYGYSGEPLVHGDIYLADETLINGRDEVIVKYFYNLEDFQFHTTDIDTQDLIPTPIEKPDQRSNGDPLVVGDYYVDYSRDLQQSLKLIISEFDSLEPRLASIPEGQSVDGMSIEEVNQYFRYNDTFIPIFLTEKIALQDMLPQQLMYGKPDVEGGTATITIRERDWEGHLSFTDYEYNNLHRSLYYTKERVGSPEQVDFADTVFVEHVDVPEFEAPYYARSRRNVEVITENSYNQLFADQHLSALSHHTGRRSSLFRKIYDIESGVFLRYLHDVCTTFFVDYSLIQKNSSKTFLRVGQLKVINGYPHGMQFAKLTDDHTEMWQDFNNDNFAEMYPEQEFSNIQFDVKREDVIRVTNQTELAINNWFETPMNTTGIVGRTKQVGDDVIITSQDPLWDYTTMVNDLVNSLQSATAEKGDDLQIYFQQDPGYNVEISYTVKRWSM